MEITVSGFVVHSGDEAARHTHRLYITAWNGMPLHTHPFAGTTSFDDGHAHQYAGMTEPAASGVQHTHGYYALTGFVNGHTHMIRGFTGPAISVPGGGHIHYFEGITSVNGRTPHAHAYQGQTGNETVTDSV